VRQYLTCGHRAVHHCNRSTRHATTIVLSYPVGRRKVNRSLASERYCDYDFDVLETSSGAAESGCDLSLEIGRNGPSKARE
jgi:hypothetical protein